MLTHHGAAADGIRHIADFRPRCAGPAYGFHRRGEERELALVAVGDLRQRIPRVFRYHDAREVRRLDLHPGVRAGGYSGPGNPRELARTW